jgi:hypothetical protein
LAACLFETFVNFRKAAQRYIPKDVYELEFLMGLFGIYFIFILFFWRFNQMGWG